MSLSDEYEYGILMNEGAMRPEKKSSKFKKILLLIIISLTLIIISAKYTTKKLIDNGKVIFNNKEYKLIEKKISVNNFEPVDSNKIQGPITVDRERDDGSKINLYENVLNLYDNKFESFYFDEESFKQLNETVPAEEKYMCETTGLITEDMMQGHDIRCPMFYHITFDKQFYGRYKHDGIHCIKNNQGEIVDSSLLERYKKMSTNCGRELPEIVGKLCAGKNSCILQPGRSILPDTCVGMGKYLHVQYHCTRDDVIKRPKIAIVMFAVNIIPNSLYENAISEFYQYADIHGYKFIFNDNAYDDGRDLFFMKLHVVSEAIVEGLKTEEYDWIFWVDGDVLLANPNIKLETFLPIDKNVHFIASSDENGLNAGVFFIRVHSWSLNFIYRAIAYRFTDKESKLVFADQTSLSNVLIKDKEEVHYTIVPQQWFNTYMKTKKSGDFIIHYAGLENKDMKANLDRETIYKNFDWGKAQTNKQLREKVVKYYNLPKDKQEKIWLTGN